MRSQRKGLAISVARVDSNSDGNSAGCTSSEFQCNNGKCVPSSYKCDVDDDCGDGSDEKDCGGSSYFNCENGQRIPAGYKCDKDDDCGDASDETNCQTNSCTTAEFQCDNQNCVSTLWR